MTVPLIIWSTLNVMDSKACKAAITPAAIRATTSPIQSEPVIDPAT